MEQIKVGPIQTSPKNIETTHQIRSQINKMKVGQFFRVYGVDRRTVNALRASISYYSKTDKFSVTTKFNPKDEAMTIYRIRMAR